MAGLLLAAAGVGLAGGGEAKAEPGGHGSPPQARPSGVADPDPRTATVLEDIVVEGRRGATEFTPEREFGAGEIDRLGAWNIGEVIARLGETLDPDEAPVVIINGRRILDPRNFTGFPPEALSRIEVLPPEAAARYGEDPGRRVLNVVLVPEFHSRDGMAGGWRPTAGGASGVNLDLRQSSIQDDDTRQYGLQIGRDTALQADERSGTATGGAGTLRPETRTIAVNLAGTGTIQGWAVSLNGVLSGRRERFDVVVDGATSPLEQSSETLALNGSVGGEAGGWTLRAGLDGLLAETRQSGASPLEARTMGLAAHAMADRRLFALPAGPATLTLSGRWNRTETRTETPGGAQERSAGGLDVRAGLGLPLSRAARRGRGAATGSLGDAALTLGGRLHQSDAADLEGGANAALSWSPVRGARFTAQWAGSTDSPSDDQRLAPVVFGAPQTVFDVQAGEAVDILPVLGGNPDLRNQRQDRMAASMSLGPFTDWRLQGNLSWVRLDTRDAIGAVPALSPAAEAAFPDRFVRDSNGRLLRIDQRPINLDRVQTETLSWALNMTVPLGDERGDAVQLGVGQSRRLVDRVALRAGYPLLDRLAGDGGSAAADHVDVRADVRLGQWTVNLEARRRAPTRVRRASGQDGPDDLRLDAFSTVDLKVGYRLERLRPATDDGPARRDPGVRLEFEVMNLFDSRQTARLGDGRPAPGYGRDATDPLGRTVRVTLRSRF